MNEDFAQMVLQSFSEVIRKYALNVINKDSTCVVLGNDGCQVAIIAEYDYAYSLMRKDGSSQWIPVGLAIRNGATIEEVFPKAQEDRTVIEARDNLKEIRNSVSEMAKRYESGIYDSFFSGDFSGSDTYLEWENEVSDC